VVYDIYKNMVNPHASEKQLMGMATGLNVLVCAIGLAIALSFTNIISVLSLSYTFLAAGCFVPLVGGIVWKDGTYKGALYSAAAGIAVTIMDTFGLISLPYASIFPILPSALVYLVVSLMTKKTSQFQYKK